MKNKEVEKALSKLKESKQQYPRMLQLVRRDEIKGKALIAQVEKATKDYCNSL